AAICVGCQPAPPKYNEVVAVNNPGGQGGEDNRAFLGTLSCSNRGCHASLDQSSATEKPLTCSFSLWNDQDPHAHAWAVLSDPATKGPHMDSLLYHNGKDRNGNPGAVWKDPRCLACHTTPQATFVAKGTTAPDYKKLTSPRDANIPVEWQFGVGCESC